MGMQGKSEGLTSDLKSQAGAGKHISTGLYTYEDI